MAERKPRGGAFLVGSGILLSRIAGLARETVFAHYFGASDAGDAFKAALKIPNFLQNLFGEGILSASFIPVYAGLLAQGDDASREQAEKTAGVVASLLALATSLLTLAGVAATPYLIEFIAPGFHGEKRELTVHIVQVIFPGTGLLVLSAWCLGILNSHRRFFLSYAAPVLWNAAIIAALLLKGGKVGQYPLAIVTAWGLVAGSVLQFGTQLPAALSLLGRFRPGLTLSLAPVRQVLHGFAPVVVARGVVQVSAYVDNLLASLLPTGAVSALAYAQIFYLLPVSLFGMSVSAAELPAMSSAVGTKEEIAAQLRTRLNAGLGRIALLIVPSAVAFLALGDIIVGAIFQSGAFTRQSTLYVWTVLAGASVGLLAATLGRLYSSAFYALKDTRTPLAFAVVRVALTTGLGYLCALKVPGWLGIAPRADFSWGTAGLTASAGLSAWVEFLLLRSSLNRRVGRTGVPLSLIVRLWLAAGTAAAAAWAIKLNMPPVRTQILAAATLLPYGAFYFLAASALGVAEAKGVVRRVFSLLRARNVS